MGVRWGDIARKTLNGCVDTARWRGYNRRAHAQMICGVEWRSYR